MTKYGIGTVNNEGFEFELPSGNTCLMHELDPTALLAAGMLDQMDTLSGLVQSNHIDRVKKGRPAKKKTAAVGPDGMKQAAELMKDKGKWDQVISFMDKVTCLAVEEPQILPTDLSEAVPPITSAQANAQVAAGVAVPVASVAIPDKIAIMQRALGKMMSGVAAAEPFRAGRSESVADVSDGESVLDSAVDPAGGVTPAG